MSAPASIVPYSLKDAPALIERLLPVQKLSAEAYKEQMANVGKTLTALGSYWKGRKPLILVRAVILGLLLPGTGDPFTATPPAVTVTRLPPTAATGLSKGASPPGHEPRGR